MFIYGIMLRKKHTKYTCMFVQFEEIVYVFVKDIKRIRGKLWIRKIRKSDKIIIGNGIK